MSIRRGAVLVALAFVPRLLAAALLAPDSDPESYFWDLATFLRQIDSLGPEAAAVEPLYPMFLAATRALTGDHVLPVAVVQAMLGAGAVLPLYGLAWTLSGSQAVATTAAVLYSLHPYLIRQSAAVTEVTLLTSFLIVAAYGFVTASRFRSAVMSGIGFGGAMLTRAIVGPCWLLATIVLARRQGIRLAAALGLATVAVTGPFVLQSVLTTGSIVPSRHGINLAVGNSRYADWFIPRYNTDLLAGHLHDEAVARLGLSDATAWDPRVNELLASDAWRFIKSHPLDSVGRFGRKLLYFFHVRLVPYAPLGPDTAVSFATDGVPEIANVSSRPLVHELAYSAAALLIGGGAVVGMWVRRRSWRQDLILYLLVGTFALTYAVYFPITRGRAPIEFGLMFFAGAGLAWLVEKMRTSLTRRKSLEL